MSLAESLYGFVIQVSQALVVTCTVVLLFLLLLLLAHVASNKLVMSSYEL